MLSLLADALMIAMRLDPLPRHNGKSHKGQTRGR